MTRGSTNIRRLLEAETDDFASLIQLSGLNPKLHLRFSDWSGIDFTNTDLRAFDFTGARLRSCNFKGALVSGARFDQAELNDSNLRSAADYLSFADGWSPAQQPSDDDHLPIGSIFHDAPWGPEMVVIPPGSFSMGSIGLKIREEEPAHSVTIDQTFAVARYPVTREQFQTFCIRTGYTIPSGAYVRDSKSRWRRQADVSWKSPGFDQSSEHPVVCVSWHDANEYVGWLTQTLGLEYNLLSEAQWEYCCSASSAARYATGPYITTSQACFEHDRTVPVGSYPANAFGLCDMHGLVWEWCADQYNGNYIGAPSDGSARLEGENNHRMLRGGGWSNDAWELRSAVRVANTPSYRGQDLGFRIARKLRA